MTTPAPRTSLLRRLGKWLLGAIGLVCILLAVALGLVRLLLGQVPEYQQELKAWVAGELGIDVDFAALNVRLGLTGPELSLRDPSIGSGFLQAEQAAITLDPMALLRRDIRVKQLTLDGVLLTIERDPSGDFRLGDYVIEPGTGRLTDTIPESVVVRIRNSTLRYVDVARELEWMFSELDFEIESDGERLAASGSLQPPDRLARRIDLSIAAAGSPDVAASSWRLTAQLAGLDLEQLAVLMPGSLPGAESGRGDIEAEAEWIDGVLSDVVVGVDFDDLQIGPAAADNDPFTRLALTAGWQRDGTDAWSLAIDDLRIERAGAAWPGPLSAQFALVSQDGDLQSVHLAADFVRLADIEPLVHAYPEFQLAEQWDAFEPTGEISDLAFDLELLASDIRYRIDMQFADLSMLRVGTNPGLSGLSGGIAATDDSGTIVFDSERWSMDWPALFGDAVSADSLAGAVVWQQWPDVISLTGANLALGVLGEEGVISFGLELPLDERPATLRLDASLAGAELVPAKAYLPTPIMPAPVVDWLNSAIVGGRARNIGLTFTGPLSSFPFDDGSGQFRVVADVEGAALAYRDGWPLAEDLDGRIEFLNAGFSARATGRVLDNRSEAATVDIPNLRRAVLTLTAATTGPLSGVVDFLRAAPLVAAELGPDFSRISVTDGNGAVTARLDLPLLDPASYRLGAELAISDGAFTIEGLAPTVTELTGTITADEHAVIANELGAQFLGGPVTATLMPSSRAGYRAELSIEGETTADAVATSFNLPHHDLVAGQTRWRGSLRLPALDPLATTRTQLTIESNLTGVALRFPEPLAKPPGDPVNLRLDIDFAAARGVEIHGNLGASRRFVLAFESGGEAPGFASGTVRFGGEEPALPNNDGILVDGRVERLDLDAWFDLAGDTPLANAGPLFLGADLEIGDFHALGQRLGATDLRVQRSIDDWEISLDSEAIAGAITVPVATAERGMIVADMQRVYLATEAEGELNSVDPRRLPGLRLTADEFGFGNRQLGWAEATLEPDPRGLVLTRFASATDNYTLDLTGSWFQGSIGTRTTVDAQITSTDIQAALTELGLDPVLAGEAAELSANLYWDSAPGISWLDHLYGEVAVQVDTGSLREIDPGAGRVLGLMSIAALPRRLALDFRDVFQDGFAFDEIRGGFTIIDGNAYTDNLMLDGPAAEIGVVGRTGLRDRDYTQQIVVRSEPGNMLPTVAGLLGGPGAGAALFVFTRLFKKSFDVIGSVSYCVTGNWDEPTVERIDDNATDRAARCADLPEEMLSEVVNE